MRRKFTKYPSKIVASTVSNDAKFLAREALNCSTRGELSSVIGSLQSIDKQLYLHYMEMLRDEALSVEYIAGQLSDELMSYYTDDVEACDNVIASEICYRDRDNDDRVVALDAGMSDEDVEELLAAHPSYYRSTLDRFEACDKVEATTDTEYFANMVNASDELDTDPIYSIEAYYSANGGLAASEDTRDFSKMLDYICDYANQGSWIRVQNNMSGECNFYSPDEWLEAIGEGEYPTSIYELQEDRSEGV